MKKDSDILKILKEEHQKLIDKLKFEKRILKSIESDLQKIKINQKEKVK